MPTHPVTEYAERVMDGQIVAGQLVRYACERHLNDLWRDDFPYYFDEDAANRIINFAPLLPHTKGEWARRGERLRMELWQQFILGSVFGWKREEDDLRRFRRCYQEVARKNGKTTQSAVPCVYMLAFEGEPGAEVYAAATKKDQARILWNTAASMIMKTPGLMQELQVVKSSSRILVRGDFEAVFRPLSRDDGQTGDGLNPYLGLVDELHQHKTSDIVDTLETAQGSRAQPLLWFITTAGADRYGVCWAEREYARNVLEGRYVDESMFAYIATIDEGDDPMDPRVWPKANPNLEGEPFVRSGSVRRSFLEEAATKASQADGGGAMSAFLRRHMNVWVGAENPWLNPDQWGGCESNFDVSKLRGRECYAGLDLARVNDLSALVLVFPSRQAGEPWYVLPYFWCPEDDIERRSRRDRVPYDQWARDGYLEATPGNTTDFRFIRGAVLDIAERFDLREVAYDRHFAGELINELIDHGIDCVPFGQGYVSMAAPVDETERLILGNDLVHDGHPVLTWMAGNAVIREDEAGNRKLDKSKSRERIDGMVAMVMAVGRASVSEGPSIYEQRGALVFGGSDGPV